MRYNIVGFAFALVIATGCDEEEPSPAPVGNSSAGPANGGSKGTTGGTDDDGDDAEEPGDGGNPGDGGSWAVGEDAEMVRIEADGGGSGYDVSGEHDLLGIACHGDQVAWAVGTSGALIYTHDGGDHWSPAPSLVDTTLRAVAISASHVIFAVGDDGVVLVSRDAGARFVDVVAPPVDFTGVTTNHDGTLAFATAGDGSIWRYDAGRPSMQLVWQSDAVLHSIAMTPSAERIVVVGDDGAWLHSVDRGQSFARRDAATDRDLHAVQLAANGSLALAVGEAGVVVHWDALGPLAEELLDDETALHGVHMSADGHGIAVGEAGVAFATVNGGDDWEPLGTPTTRDLFGVDEISLHGHL